MHSNQTHVHPFSSPNSGAYVGGVSEEECLLSEEEACNEYNKKLVELARLIEDTAPNLGAVKSLASEITAIKMAQPSIKVGEDSPLLKKALAAAKKATADFGSTSKEAALAWEDVEELAAASSHNAPMGANLLDECLVEQLEACEGLEELQRVLSLVKENGRYGG